jgi:NADPH-dependent glutamate synthase beta subunit-like oxidoreductase
MSTLTDSAIRRAASAHAVAVIGGATAGAEVAAHLAQRGVRVVVFDQNPRPYGKVEDGLPRWHRELRRKEYETIRSKLCRPGVHFVPLTKIGADIAFDDLVLRWGFSAVVLACGAWRDRPLPIEGAERFLGRGLVYQNAFIIWFNHANEKNYAGERFEAQDGALVVGGGLASIDVVKVLMLETTREALSMRGIDLPLIELEVKGIPKMLATHGLSFADLGLACCTLFYRRRVEDMPLVETPDGADSARVAKVEHARRRLLEKAIEKYCFKVEPLAAPEALVTESDRLVGLRFRRNRHEGGRLVPTDEAFERRGSCVISSIGSIPEPLPGIATKGELFCFTDWEFGRMAEYPMVFSAGNVVTGKGNIVASRKHATRVVEGAVVPYLGLADEGHAGEERMLEPTSEAARAEAERVARELAARPPLTPEGLSRLFERVAERQRRVGYHGSVESWIEKVTPPDLE